MQDTYYAGYQQAPESGWEQTEKEETACFESWADEVISHAATHTTRSGCAGQEGQNEIS